jgi:hypothetical protein
MIDRVLRAPQLYLMALLVLVFAIHAAYLNLHNIPLSDNLTWQAYIFNALAAVLILTFMLRLAQKSKDYLGFVFMGGSLLKFLVFFVFFYPVYKADDKIQALEFSSFFIPYLICLSFKSFVLLKSLNRP